MDELSNKVKIALIEKVVNSIKYKGLAKKSSERDNYSVDFRYDEDSNTLMFKEITTFNERTIADVMLGLSASKHSVQTTIFLYKNIENKKWYVKNAYQITFVRELGDGKKTIDLDRVERLVELYCYSILEKS